MTTISLHKYLTEINGLLENSRTSEVIAHCRHILQHFPRHVGVYRILAQALLEQREYDDATDLFHRILSTDPSDFVSHLGLAVIHEDQESLGQSIWHMERAYEMKPYDPVVQRKLRELYSQDDALARRPLSLTRGALARFYLRGELFQQAALELRQAILQEEDRIDLVVLLAETLWRDGQRMEAAELCRQILEKLPNCIQANAILAEIWFQTGRTEEAHEHLKRVQELVQLDAVHCDVETVVGRAFTANGSQLLPEQVEIEYLGTVDVSDGISSMSAVSDWGADSAFPEGEESEGMFTWLREDVFGDDDAATGASMDQGMTDEIEPATSGPASSIESLWLVDSESAEETTGSGELPDWLQIEEGTDELLAESGELPDGIALEMDDSSADLGDFAGEDGVELPSEEAEPSATGEVSEASGWLTETADSDFEPVQADPSQVESTWFAASDHDLDLGDAQDMSISDGSLADEDWLSMLDEAGDESTESIEEFDLAMSDLSLSEDDAEVPEWMTGEEAEQEDGTDISEQPPSTFPADIESEASPEEEGEEIPEWLSSGGLGTDLASEADEQPAEAEEPAFPPSDVGSDEDLPAWLQSEQPQFEEPTPIPADVEAELVAASQPLDETSPDELPDWLSGVEADSEGVEEVSETPAADSSDGIWEESDIPDWLRSESIDTGEAVGTVEDAIESIGLSTDLLMQGEADIPDWLHSDQLVSDEQAEAGDQLSADVSEPQEETTDLPSFEEPEEGDLPDWMQDDRFNTVVGLKAVDLAGESLGLSTDKLSPSDEDETELTPEEEQADLLAALGGAKDVEDLDQVAPAEVAEDEALPDWMQADQFDTLVGLKAVDLAGESLGLSTDELASPDAGGAELPEEEETDERPAADAMEIEELEQRPEIELEEEESPEWLRDEKFDTMIGLKVVDDAGESIGLTTQVLSSGEFDLETSEPSEEAAEPDEPETQADEIESDVEIPSTGVSESEDLPSWLKEEHMDTEAGLEIVEQAVDSLGLSTDILSQGDADIPDWLQEADADETIDWDDDSLAEALEEIDDVPSTGVTEDDELPSWLRESQHDTQAGVDVVADAMESLGLSTELLAMGEADIPDWLQVDVSGEGKDDIEPEAVPEETSELAGGDSGEDVLPDWLAEEGSGSFGILDEAIEGDLGGEEDGEQADLDEELESYPEPEAEDEEELAIDDVLEQALGSLDDAEMSHFEELLAGAEEQPLADEFGEEEEELAELISEFDALEAETPEDEEALEALSDLDWLQDEPEEAPIEEAETVDEEEVEPEKAEEEEEWEELEIDESADWLGELAKVQEVADDEQVSQEPGLDEALEAMLEADQHDLEPEPSEVEESDDSEEIADEPDSEPPLPEMIDDKVDALPEMDQDVDLMAYLEEEEAEEISSELEELLALEQDLEPDVELTTDLTADDEAAAALGKEDEGVDWLAELAGQDEEVSETSPELEELLASVEDGEPELEGEVYGMLESDSEMAQITEPDLDVPAAEPAPDAEEDVDWLTEFVSDEEPAPETEPDLDVESVAELEIELEEPVEASGPALEATDDVADVPEDLDDAMAWLEQLAAAQGAPVEELTTVADEVTAVADEITETRDIDEADLETEPEPEGEMGDAEAEPEMAETPEAPEDLDDAMAWLEGLAARQGAPADELPTLELDDLQEAEAEVQDEVALKPELAKALDWLDQIAVEQQLPVAETGEADMAVEVNDEELGEALDWLEQIAISDEAESEDVAYPAEVQAAEVMMVEDEPEGVETIIELPADEVVPDSVDEEALEEPMLWLEKEDVEESADEISMDLAGDFAEAETTPEIDVAEAEELEEAQEEMPDELDIQPTFGADDDALFTPSVDLTEGVLEDDFLDDVPEDPEAALAWLEQFVEGEVEVIEEEGEVSAETIEATDADELDDVAMEDEQEDHQEADVAEMTSDLLEEFGDELDSEFLEQIPDDPDQAVAWLQQFIEDEFADEDVADATMAAPEIEIDPVEVEGGDGVYADVPALESDMDSDGDLLAEMPEDPDEAMAWLQNMAERQETIGDELPSPEIIEDTGPLVEDSIPMDLPAEDDLEPVLDERISTGQLEAMDDRLEQDLSDSLPDWLMFESEDEAESAVDQEWMDAEEELDVTGWLEVEDEAAGSGVVDIDSALTEAETKFGTGQLAAIEEGSQAEEDELYLPDTDRLSHSVVDIDENQLTLARQTLRVRDYDEAIDSYQALVEKGEGISILISDLELATEEHENQPLLTRLLGDAYMRNGQLQKALDNYRDALDQL